MIVIIIIGVNQAYLHIFLCLGGAGCCGGGRGVGGGALLICKI